MNTKTFFTSRQWFQRSIYLLALILPLSFFSCQVTKTDIDSKIAIENLCFQTDANKYYYQLGETISTEEVEDDPELTDRFSSKALRVANAGGLIPLLKKFIKTEEKIDEDDSSMHYLRYVALKQEIHQNISLVTLDVESIIAEIECERERTRGIAEFMDNKRSSRRQKYALAALAVSSLTSLTSGIIDLSVEDTRADDYISLSGAIVGSGLSLLAAIYQPRTSIKHSPNLLTDVWESADESELFPPFVWKMMKLEERAAESVSAPPMEVLIKGWQETNFFTDLESEEEVSEAEDLFFGEGGEYSVGLLNAREEMLNQLQTGIRLIQQEINILLRELNHRE